MSAENRERRRTLIVALPALALCRHAPANATPAGPAVLTIDGAVSKPNRGTAAEFDMPMLERFAQRSIRTATPWHEGEPLFTGPLLREVLAAAGAEGRKLRMTALNDYRIDVPREDAEQFDVIVARLVDGRPMPVRDKGPLFVMYPFDRHPQLRTTLYFSRCIWQLRRIDVL
jgi:hypothetical protein